MNVSYKGLNSELPPKMQAKLDAKFAKLSKLLEKRGQREAHVIVREERHLTRAEITIQFYDHQLVAEGSDRDLFLALSAALEKLEGQALKQRNRWREKHRRETPPSHDGTTRKSSKSAPVAVEAPSPRVFRVSPGRKKPITVDEAVLMMDKKKDYLVFRDAQSDGVSVLVRRSDGHFDLIEG